MTYWEGFLALDIGQLILLSKVRYFLMTSNYCKVQYKRPSLVFIWAKILVIDCSCQEDLVRDQSQKNSLILLQDPLMLLQHKAWAVFVLSSWHGSRLDR